MGKKGQVKVKTKEKEEETHRGRNTVWWGRKWDRRIPETKNSNTKCILSLTLRILQFSDLVQFLYSLIDFLLWSIYDFRITSHLGYLIHISGSFLNLTDYLIEQLLEFFVLFCLWGLMSKWFKGSLSFRKMRFCEFWDYKSLFLNFWFF